MPTPMSLLTPGGSEERQELGRHWFWLVALGVALIIMGGLAISFPAMATLTTVSVFGFILMVGAVVEIASAFWVRQWSGFFLHLFVGVLYGFLGLVLMDRPALGAAGYTLVLAMFFIAGG